MVLDRLKAYGLKKKSDNKALQATIAVYFCAKVDIVIMSLESHYETVDGGEARART